MRKSGLRPASLPRSDIVALTPFEMCTPGPAGCVFADYADRKAHVSCCHVWNASEQITR